jgi:large subunit ribosomal protein L9
MEILLIENLISLGSRGDIVNVKPGYARNFLLPNKIGIPVTAGNKRQIELEKEKAQKIRATEVLEAEQIKLSGVKVIISKKVGENGHLFGSVTNAEVASLLLEKGFKIDKHQINAGRIKSLGIHSIEVKVYSGITASIEVDVVALKENEKA